MKVAKSFLDQGKKLSFAVANKNIFSHDVSELGLDSSSGELPVIGIRTAKGDKYVMQEEFTWVLLNTGSKVLLIALYLMKSYQFLWFKLVEKPCL